MSTELSVVPVIGRLRWVIEMLFTAAPLVTTLPLAGELLICRPLTPCPVELPQRSVWLSMTVTPVGAVQSPVLSQMLAVSKMVETSTCQVSMMPSMASAWAVAEKQRASAPATSRGLNLNLKVLLHRPYQKHQICSNGAGGKDFDVLRDCGGANVE